MLCCKMKHTRFTVMINLGYPDILTGVSNYLCCIKKENIILTNFRNDKVMYENHLKEFSDI